MCQKQQYSLLNELLEANLIIKSMRHKNKFTIDMTLTACKKAQRVKLELPCSVA